MAMATPRPAAWADPEVAEARRPLWRRLAGVRRAVSSVARPLTARSELLRRGSLAPTVLVFDGAGGGGGAGPERSRVVQESSREVWGRSHSARGLGALAATLAAAAALVGMCQWLYGAAEVRLLPLPLLLAGVGLVLLAGLLSALVVFRLKVAGRVGPAAGVHQPAVFAVLLLCGFGLPVGESQFAEAGYLHPLLVRIAFAPPPTGPLGHSATVTLC
jgi:hypothetical protein